MKRMVLLLALAALSSGCCIKLNVPLVPFITEPSPGASVAALSDPSTSSPETRPSSPSSSLRKDSSPTAP